MVPGAPTLAYGAEWPSGIANIPIQESEARPDRGGGFLDSYGRRGHDRDLYRGLRQEDRG